MLNKIHKDYSGQGEISKPDQFLEQLAKEKVRKNENEVLLNEFYSQKWQTEKKDYYQEKDFIRNELNILNKHLNNSGFKLHELPVVQQWVRLLNDKLFVLSNNLNNIGENKRLFQVNHSLLGEIYDYCNAAKKEKDKVFFCDFSDFVKAVESGNLCLWRINVKNKAHYLIFKLSSKIEGDWYGYAAKSIGLKPDDCSSVTVTDSWKNGLVEIIYKKRI